MAAAACDYLAIPALKVLCKRLFSVGRDMIGLYKYSLHLNTMRQLVLLQNSMRKGRQSIVGEDIV
jgi:hypothetical protein